MHMQKNESIKCSVSQCRFNNHSDNYCTLSTINVGTHETNPKAVECTDCQSFVLK